MSKLISATHQTMMIKIMKHNLQTQTATHRGVVVIRIDTMIQVQHKVHSVVIIKKSRCWQAAMTTSTQMSHNMQLMHKKTNLHASEFIIYR